MTRDPWSTAHVRGLDGCSLFRMRRGSQPGGPRLAHGFEKVELVTAGRCWTFDAAGAEAEATPGTIIWHQPGDRLIHRSDPDDPYACLVVTWTVRRSRCPRPPRLARWEDAGEIAAFASQLLAWCSDERIDRSALAVASYAALRLRAQVWEATGSRPSLSPQLARVVAEVEADPARAWSVTAMASSAGWSPSRLHAAFRSELRRTPHQMLLDMRLRRARELLAAGSGALPAVAAACGLGSAAALCRLFRRRVGLSPAAWRRRQIVPEA